MEFCKNAVLLYQKEELEKCLFESEHLTKEQLEEEYHSYQEIIYSAIKQNPLKCCTILTFFNKKLFAYFCTRFAIDEFDIDTHIDNMVKEFFIIVKWNKFGVKLYEI